MTVIPYFLPLFDLRPFNPLKCTQNTNPPFFLGRPVDFYYLAFDMNHALTFDYKWGDRNAENVPTTGC